MIYTHVLNRGGRFRDATAEQLAIAGAGAGAATGGLVGLLVGTGIPEHRAKVYDTDVRGGGILLGVEAKNDDDVEKLETLLEDIGRADWTALLVPANKRVQARVVAKEAALGSCSVASSATALTRFIHEHAVWGMGGRTVARRLRWLGERPAREAAQQRDGDIAA